MLASVILLIILGLAFIFGSFVLLENKEDKEDENIIRIPENLSDEQKEKINKLIDDYMDEHIDVKLDDIEKKFSEIVNQKTLALGDYAVSVNEEIERNHSEVMFLYSMLADKQKEIMTTASMVDDYKKEVKQFIEENESKKEESKEQQLAIDFTEIEDSDEDMDADSDEQIQSASGNKDIILEMHKSGLSILEIAKNLGLGVGEVKLIVDLYQGE